MNEVKLKVSAVEEQQKICDDCIGLKNTINHLYQERTKEQSVIKCQGDRIVYLESKVAKLKAKYAKLKEKRSATLQIEEDLTSIGSLRIPTNKLNMCRTSTYTRFIGDLLEVVFGRDVLANSVIKGIKGGSSKTNILDPEKVREIQAYVAAKFNVDPVLVRAAIRRKLNIADRIKKEKVCTDNEN